MFAKIVCGGCVGNDSLARALPPPMPCRAKINPDHGQGPGAYARQPIARAMKDKTTARIIPLSVSIVCAPAVDIQTIARLAFSVNQSFAIWRGNRLNI